MLLLFDLQHVVTMKYRKYIIKYNFVGKVGKVYTKNQNFIEIEKNLAPFAPI
jgi:hypothetical protein